MAKNPTRGTDSPHVKEFIFRIKAISGRYHTYEVFRDFIQLTARCIHNQFFMFDEKLEQEFMEIKGKYEAREWQILCELFGVTQMALAVPQDFLGECYMRLEIANERAGQFFTPYHVSVLMASMLMSEELNPATMPGRDFVSVSDPCCGAGGMLVAGAELLAQRGVDVGKHVFMHAQDIDQIAAEMCYIQLSIRGIPAEVVVGNSLNREVRRIYYTPALRRHNWFERLSAYFNAAVEPSSGTSPEIESATPAVVAPSSSLIEPVAVTDAVVKELDRVMAPTAFSGKSQLVLF